MLRDSLHENLIDPVDLHPGQKSMVPHPVDQLSRPLKDLRISVIDQCNFRCSYCMPQDSYKKYYQFLKEDHWLQFDEITRLARIMTELGVRKIRLTGGEPLLRPKLTQLIRDLRRLPNLDDLALTTNGSLLAPHAASLREAGLQRITVSLDTVDVQSFRQLSGHRGHLSQVLEGIKAAEKAGFSPIKINAVIQRGVNDRHILNLVDHFRHTPHILRLIEYMDAGNCNDWHSSSVISSAEILALIRKHYPVEPVEASYYGEVASRYRYMDTGGEIGFISSITQPFCGSCTRLRLTTDGKIFTCLFAGRGTDLKNFLRLRKTDEEILSVLRAIWEGRKDRYSELRRKIPLRTKKVEMFQIGG